MSGNEQMQQQRQEEALNVHAEPLLQQAPQDHQPQQAGRLHRIGHRMADFFLRHLPAAAGDAQPPQAPQPAPPAQQQAPRNKQERRLRQQEAERLEKHNQLLAQDTVLNAMAEFANAEEAQAMDRVKAFLLSAARALHAQNGPAPETKHMQMVDSYRILVARRVQDDGQAQILYNTLDAFERSFQENAELDQLIPIINQDVASIFRDEMEQFPIFKQAMERLAEEATLKNSRRLTEFPAFEDVIARTLGLQAKPGQALASVTHAPTYAPDLQADVRNQFRDKVAAEMREQGLTQEIARQLVLEDMRNSAKQDRENRAAAISLKKGVVHNVSQADMQRYGSASFQQTVPAAQAQKILASSNGFLYGKKVGDDLVELRPTLPKTAEFNGKTYPLRRVYNLLIKSIVSQLIGEDGQMLEGANEFASRLEEAFLTKLADISGGSEYNTKKAIHEGIQESIKPGLEKFLSEGEELDSTLELLEELVFHTLQYDHNNCRGTALLPFEILDTVVSFPATMSQVAVPLKQRKQTVRAVMAKDGYSKAEIAAKLEALTSMYQDRDAALQEMLKIREMDPDSLDVPLPNTCSANGFFFQGLTKTLLPEQLHSLRYYTEAHVQADPQSHLDYIRRKDPDIVNEDHPLHAEYQRVEEELHQNPPVLSEESRVFLTKQTKNNMKYVYHVAANVGSLEDGTVITVEEFAAETTQLVVSPFSTRGAVGLYRGGQAGMNGYYNLDNPLPTEEAGLLDVTNLEIKRYTLPGDKDYIWKHPQAAGTGGNA